MSVLHPLGILHPSRPRLLLFIGAVLAGTSIASWAIVTDLSLVALLHSPAAEEHVDQYELYNLVSSGMDEEAFELAFESGDELFETRFNALDGVGANVGDGQRFTRVPRADLVGPTEWAKHVPPRTTGPNAESCSACHNTPFDDGAGSAAGNVHRDPLHSANLGSFIQRNTPHLFAPGALQRLAEEMTTALHQLRDDAVSSVCTAGGSVSVSLVAKGIDFGSLTVTQTGSNPCTVAFDTSAVRGVSADLVVRPFQWKGSVAFVRDFNRGAAHNELGMQGTEMCGDGIDGDFDGVVDELSVGDQTALAIYLAAQPRPTSLVELSKLGLLEPPLTAAQTNQIQHGRRTFEQIGCTVCHVPELNIDDPIFHEPSQNEDYRDALLPAGQDPLALGLDPTYAVSFDLTEDQPDNQLQLSGGRIFHLGALKQDDQGGAIVELFGDLKRHDMGLGLAERIDEVGTGASVFLTENLWGVGSTAPYLHDGRATTLTEAILEHDGEARASRDAFVILGLNQQQDVIAFLENLVLFKIEEGEAIQGRLRPLAQVNRL